MPPLLLLLSSLPIFTSPCLDALLAEVNTRIITFSDVLFERDILFIEGGERPAREGDADTLPPSSKDIFERLVDFNVILTFAKRAKMIRIHDEEVQLALHTFRKMFRSDEGYRGFCKKWDVDEEILKEYFRDRLLVERYIKMRVELYSIVPEKELKRIIRKKGLGGEGVELKKVERGILDSIKEERYRKRYEELLAELKKNSKIRFTEAVEGLSP